MKHQRADYNLRIQDADGLIPEDEPVFLLRAQDKLALATIRYYRHLCFITDNRVMGESLLLHEVDFQLWEDNHPETMKVADLPIQSKLF